MLTISEKHHLIDTHCHLLHIINKNNVSAFSHSEMQEIRKILHQAHLKKVTRIIEIGTNRVDSILSIELAKLFPHILPVVGIHPNELSELQHDVKAGVSFLKKLLSTYSDTIVGIGECGLDKHYPEYNLQAQQDLFQAQIELALEYHKALVVHTRDAQEETYAMLERYKHDLKRVTIHCYSNDLDFARAVTSWGWYIGIGGTVTYPKNNTLRDIVKAIGLSHIVLETDAPFLAPQAIRGKPNSPEHIATIAEYIAELLAVSIDEVAVATTKNAEKLFGL